MENRTLAGILLLVIPISVFSNNPFPLFPKKNILVESTHIATTNDAWLVKEIIPISEKEKLENNDSEDSLLFPLTDTLLTTLNRSTEIPQVEGVVIENLESVNTSALEFSPILYRNGIVFSSTRIDDPSTKNSNKQKNGKFSDLFFAEQKEGAFQSARRLSGVNGKLHDGNAAFNPQGDYMIFTRNNKKGKSKKGIRELKLYEATLKAGKWTNVKILNLNNNEYTTCHPTLSQDGKRLYFSSNRPGGYGGMDIYLSRKVNGTWLKPQNLGPIVNSSGNEVFPYLHQDEKLYFSSNGHPGVGGLDIFVVEKLEAANETSWANLRNLGTPFNSRKDDMGFIIEKEMESGYLASNRKGGKGRDDIYRWKMESNTVTKTEEKQIDKTFCVYNIMNNERIEGANISVLSGSINSNPEDLMLALAPSPQSKNELVLSIKNQEGTFLPNTTTATDNQGLFQYSVLKEQDYFFILSKKGYSTVQHRTDFSTVSSRNEYCIAMAPRSCRTLKGFVKNKDFNQPVPFAEVQIFNRCTGESLPTRSDENGQFEFCVDSDCEFEILATKEKFKEKMVIFSTLEKTSNSSHLETVVVNLELVNRKEEAVNYARNSNTSPQQHPFNNTFTNPDNQGYAAGPSKYSKPNASNTASTPPSEEFLVEYFTGNSDTEITAGQTFILKNIYYDFDKHNIRLDAGIELDYIVDLMLMKPTMEISMKAHTDTRGDGRYNNRLSRKRAEAARTYLISKGIAPNRIYEVMGMGESQPVLPCNNDLDCTEREHQINRRTEITVLKI